MKGPATRAGPFVSRTVLRQNCNLNAICSAPRIAEVLRRAENSELWALGWMLYPVWLLPTLNRSNAICALSRCFSGKFCV